VEGRYIKGSEEWERSCREEIVTALVNQKTPEGKKTTRSMDEVPYQYDRLGGAKRLHDYLMDLEVFSYLYKNEETTLGDYWRQLIDREGEDYDCYNGICSLEDTLEEYLTEVSQCGETERASVLLELSSFTRETLVNPSLSIRCLEIALGCINNDVEKAKVLDNIGRSYGLSGDQQRALEYGLRALDIRQKIYGENHQDVAASYDNVGWAYYKLRNYQKALEYKEKAMVIRRSIFGENHLDVGSSYNNIGLAYGALGDYPKKLEYMEKALSIVKRIYGEVHADVATVIDNMGGGIFSIR